LTRLMRNHGLTLLRYTLAIVFIWFGALKITGHTPVTDLVASTVYWLPAQLFVPFLGAWEVLVGVLLILAVAPRTTLALFWLQLAGTFLVLVVRPEVAFQGGNPLLLTVEGEFVIKNLVLVASGIVLGGALHRRRRSAEFRDAVRADHNL
ncbi:MAG TPA: hypothetical protein VNZ52_16680, partial [Candidatus Thermoplasmatota archaeon]|nr:hypothetical protein [Candidatus Thermoplasmatota archaeon]